MTTENKNLNHSCFRHRLTPVGQRFKYARWSLTKGWMDSTGVVTHSYWDDVGRVVVYAKMDDGREESFWNDSFVDDKMRNDETIELI